MTQKASWQGHAGALLLRANGHDIIFCEKCGFRHAIPLPGQEDLDAAYRETYYAEEKPTYLAHAGEDAEWAALSHADRLSRFAALLGEGRRRLLDIGSGPGFFLQSARQAGWQALGVEPSRQACAHAQGLGAKIVNAFFDPDSAARLGRFDAVHMNNVLEHVPDPAGLIGLAHGLLDPGGLICINVPNDFTEMQQAAQNAVGAGPWWAVPPHHLNYFDFPTLEALLTRLGFAVLERGTSFPMELFLLMGENYVGDPALGRACHAKRKRFDLMLERHGGKARQNFYRALADAGIGREAVVIARKS